jgi:thiol-disulfide isomerase/thioredoxin
MRRKILLALPILVLLFLTACASSSPEQIPVTESVQTAPVAPATAANEGEASAESAIDSESQSEKDTDETVARSETMEQSEEMMSEDESDDSMAESNDDESMTETMVDEEEMAAESTGEMGMVIERPAWHHAVLANARTGESFSLADFEGKTIFVEPMATWCSNCRKQLNNVRDARQELASEDVIFIAVSVETNIDNATLTSYADGAGFDWLFAVATPDLLRLLADEFGQTIANPPATPHFIVRSDGTSTELVTGIEAAGQIVSQITAAQG